MTAVVLTEYFCTC